MKDVEALNLAIFAVATLREPDASSFDDVAYLDDHAEEVTEVLVRLRQEARRGDALAASPVSEDTMIGRSPVEH